MDAFAAVRFAVGVGFLTAAAASDVRTRRVRDPLWIALGSLGIGIAAVELAVDQVAPVAWAILGSAGILFYAIFFGRPLFDEDGFHARPARIVTFLAAALLFFVPIVASGATGPALPQQLLELYAMPVMILVYQGLWRLRLLYGGADAKALIALTLLFPRVPDALPFPVLRAPFDLPFSFTILINASILFLAVPVAYLTANTVRGEAKHLLAVVGVRTDIDHLPEHAWLMEKINARGEHVAMLFPPRGGDRATEIAKLKAAGIRRVWVQPKFPMMILLLTGLVLAFVLGDLLLAFIVAIRPRA